MANHIELDDATKAALKAEAGRLVSMGMDLKKARRIVWEDYQAELAEYQAPILPLELETPVPEPPVVIVMPVTNPAPATAPQASFFTPDRLERNRIELAKVKRLVGLGVKHARNP